MRPPLRSRGVDDAKGFQESKHAARKGGEVAGKAREDLEHKTRKKVVSKENYLTMPQSAKKLEKK
jgi:DNA-damage-inducible protein D